MSQSGPESEEARRFLVSGKVQGVFFRASTVRMAGELGLRGYARNLADGRVEILAVGAPSAVSKLAAWLRDGPPLARVAEVSESNESVIAYADVQDFRSA